MEGEEVTDSENRCRKQANGYSEMQWNIWIIVWRHGSRKFVNSKITRPTEFNKNAFALKVILIFENENVKKKHILVEKFSQL